MPVLRFHLLGPLRIWHDETEITLSSDRQKAVLALLLLKAGTPVRRQEIIDAVWGDDAPGSAVNLVQTYVGRLRRRLEPGHVARSRSSLLTGLGTAYAIRPDRCDSDLVRFRALVAEARSAGSPRESLGPLLRALEMWQGPCLADLDHVLKGHPWVHAIDRERMNVLLECAKTALDLGMPAEVLPQLRAVAAAEPLSEVVHSWLVLALAAAGAQAEALAEYESIRTRLADELGIDPGPQLRGAHLRVLRQDAAPSSPFDRPASAGTLRPSLLPPDIAGFFGREKQASRIRGALAGRGPGPVAVAVISGQGGVGKTALAVHVAHQLGDAFPDGQLYADLRGTGERPADPARVLARFLRALGVHEAALPRDLEESVDLYRSQLAGRRILVVLDDVDGYAQVRPLLPGSCTCAVLVTSRSRLSGWPGAASFDLGTLSFQQSHDMLAEMLGRERVDAEPENAAEIVRLCCGLPLALRAAGTRLTARPHWALARVAGRLAGEGLDELALGDLDVRRCVAAGYRRVSETAQRTLRLLGLLDLPSFPVWTIAMMLETSPESAEEIADALADARLLEVARPDGTGRTRYRFHELVRRFAREQAAAAEIDSAVHVRITRTLATLLALAQEADERLPPPRYAPVRGRAPRWPPPAEVRAGVLADPLGWFESELAGLVAAVFQAGALGLTDLAWELAATLPNVSAVRARWADVERTHRFALAACRRAGDALGEAVMLRGLAEAHHGDGRRDECLGALRTAGVAFADLGAPAAAAEIRTRYRELAPEFAATHETQGDVIVK
ncbi:NB-ARC domain-containing protein [Microbispora sp. NBC_01189]|uniref:AfsR/SARP family transcriptional regulator n=1 Tax=Microbispora sp. NBC_01189 TaxID=2903583 RepID=UPI002E158D31|nr:NB-ARC domain-containing protein [Microbispora sp. NBC_01189]